MIIILKIILKDHMILYILYYFYNNLYIFHKMFLLMKIFEFLNNVNRIFLLNRFFKNDFITKTMIVFLLMNFKSNFFHFNNIKYRQF